MTDTPNLEPSRFDFPWEGLTDAERELWRSYVLDAVARAWDRGNARKATLLENGYEWGYVNPYRAAPDDGNTA